MSFLNRSAVRRPKLVAIFSGLAGLATLTIGLWLISTERAFETGAVALEARVVSVKVDRSGQSDNALFTPTFAFTDTRGTPRNAPSAHSDKAYNFAVGQIVPILFNSRQPDKVMVNSGRQSSRGLTIALGSLVFFVPALFGFLVHRRRKAVAPDYEQRTYLPEDESMDEQVRAMAGGYSGWFLRKPVKMAWITGVLGAFFLVAGVSTLISDNTFKKTALPTTATVLSVALEGSDFRPTVGFKTQKGEKITARSALSDTSYNFPIGQQVPLYYNPANPQDIRLKGGLEDGVFAYAVTFFALILLGMMLWSIFIHRSYQKERARRASLPEAPEAVYSYKSGDDA